MEQAVDPYAQLKELAKVVWTAGDYNQIATLTQGGAPQVLEECELEAGHEVLEVGAGNGNFAVLAAQQGARVTASDITPAQVERGRARTEAEGLDIEWLEADAEDLPFEDRTFDRVVTLFSAMDAPRPERVARELFRVVRPGGIVVMANWHPDGFVGAMSRLVQEYAPAPQEDAAVPTEWGDPEIARERLAPYTDEIRTEVRSTLYAGDSPEEFFLFLERHHGLLVLAPQILGDRYEQLAQEIRDAIPTFNKATDGSLRIDADFLLVVARAPA